MYITVTFEVFCDMFGMYNMEHNFSYEAKKALFKYYDELGDHELDVVAISCEWSEYETINEVKSAHSLSATEILDHNTEIIHLAGGGIILQDFLFDRNEK